ncbi:MAG: hypothetical protein KIS78_31690 [Labilithrix sp.]|nr:hypothetical protein [Labilithrix sp.]
MMKAAPSRLAWLIALVPVAGVVAACVSRTDVSIGSDCATGFCEDPPSFTPASDAGEDGGEGGASEPEPPVLACIGTECPEPYASCSKTPSFLCGTNLKNDPANCGACGVSCQGFEGLNLGSRCVEGACAFECLVRTGPMGESYEFRDCNGLLDDGCEVNVSADPANCGACGNACAKGERCINGKCGCTSGKIDCHGRCVDPRFDDSHCSRCDSPCEWMPEDACDPAIPNTYYGCVLGQCGKLKCSGGFADCNGDLSKGCASDGCETNTSTDPNHCGACGIQCGPGQECRDDGNGPQCLDTCEKAGLTSCAFGCADLVGDRFNCGACGYFCPNPRANEQVSCKKGLCATECLPGFADCNGDRSDGCEVDLNVHPAHCGACGAQCNYGAGQPCIEGKCLMVECDAGVVTK